LGSGLRNSKVIRQTSTFFVCQVIGLVLGFGVNLINTRALGPVDYGLYAATFAATQFVTLILDFGVFSSGARLLAINQDEPELQRRLVGALILSAGSLSLMGALVLYGLSFFVVSLLNAPIQHLLRVFSVLLGLLTFQTLVEATCRGTGRIERLAFFSVANNGFGLVLLGITFATGIYSLSFAVAASLISSLAAAILLLSSFRPIFRDLGGVKRELWRDLKGYGFHAYTGDLASTGSSRTDSLILSHFVNSTAVGYYRLATLTLTPMSAFSQSLSTTLFTRFALARRISPRVFAGNGFWLGLCVLGVVIAGNPTIRLVFGSKYDTVATLLPIVAIASLFGGLALPINKFLGAQGQGRYLKKIALILSFASLLFNFGLIPRFGIWGACYAAALSMLSNFLLHFYFYRKTVRSLEHANALNLNLRPSVTV